MNIGKSFILLLIACFYSCGLFAQTEADRKALEKQVAALMLEKSAAESKFREQTILQSKLDSFLDFHQKVIAEIAANIKSISEFQNQIDSVLEIDSKILNEISAWLESALSNSRYRNNSVSERNQIELQRKAYERSCRTLASRKLVADTDELLSKTMALIILYRERSKDLSNTPGVPETFQTELAKALSDMSVFEVSAKQMELKLQVNDKDPEICSYVRDLSRVLDVMEIYNSTAVFLNTDGLVSLSKDISSFLLGLDKDIQDTEKVTFVKRYLIALAATNEDYHRRGLIEKMNLLSLRFSEISLFLKTQTKSISNIDDRKSVDAEINKSLSDLSQKQMTMSADFEDMNAILYRRLKYLMAKAIIANSKKALSLDVASSLSAVGIDMTSKKINFVATKDFGEVMDLCNKIAPVEEKLAKE